MFLGGLHLDVLSKTELLRGVTQLTSLGTPPLQRETKKKKEHISWEFKVNCVAIENNIQRIRGELIQQGLTVLH